MTIENYIQNINKDFTSGRATEHTYRGDLEQLLETILPEITVMNEQKRIACGAPDYVLIDKNKIPRGYIEAKDIGGKDLLGKKENKSQFDRYKNDLENLIFTDYLTFLLFKKDQFVAEVRIAEVANGKIVAKPENFEAFKRLIVGFSQNKTQTIFSPVHLAEMMANKAKSLADYIAKALKNDEESSETSMLKGQMNAFKDILMHDLTIAHFADVYAQTIAYGMFVARYHDSTLETFSRAEATRLIPKSNPFLRQLFKDIEDNDLDVRIDWVIDDLVSIFLASNVKQIMSNYGKETQQDDVVIHFYETFLAAYDPKLRKARGVWYTPAPVVNFIVRAVDEILKTDFGLSAGLADTSKIKMGALSEVEMSPKTPQKEVHRVQILDPATGTGTFLAEVIKHIYKRFEKQKGIWSGYVEKELIPRLNGFELLMASYAMAHLQLDLLLTETGYVPTSHQRLKVYLTNSLEEHHPDTGTIWAQPLANEANEANAIKRDVPVMCVIGNPPYSVSSSNKSEWIENLVADYKKDMNERNIQPLSDDYIKFIRFGQHFIDKNGNGILAYISNNSFIDGIIHRQMRKNLLESFDKIYILDLHGNAKKKEICADGSPDKNVFDIMQGVSINIFVKTGKQKKDALGEVFHFDLQGKRQAKYDFLLDNSLKTIQWNKLIVEKPNFFFVKKDFQGGNEYEMGFKIDTLFALNTVGVSTFNDDLTVKFSKEELLKVINFIKNNDNIELIRNELNIKENSRDWTLENAKNDIDKQDYNKNIGTVFYRPFDWRFTLHTTKSKGFIAYPRPLLVHNLLQKDNFSLNTVRQSLNEKAVNTFITKGIICRDSITSKTYSFPLYLYPEATQQQSLLLGVESGSLSKSEPLSERPTRKPNLDATIIQKIAEAIGLPFVSEKANVEGRKLSKSFLPLHTLHTPQNNFAPIDVLDYIYAVLHSPTYRETYKEFLKIDFPRVPYPKDAATFWQLVALGREIREIHLLESEKVENYITEYPINGDNRVGKIRYVAAVVSGDTDNGSDTDNGGGKVYINETQYFDHVPEVAWTFYIGGYQPAQKWLKDRKERVLSFEDILHYQKIIVALVETDRIMKEVDKMGVL